MCIDWLRHVLTRGFGAQIQMLWQTPKNRPIVTVRHLKFADFQVVGSEFLKVVFSLIKILTIYTAGSKTAIYRAFPGDGDLERGGSKS